MASPREEDALTELYYLTSDATKNWRKLLKYSDSLDLQFKRKILWIWPTETSLWQINKILRDFEINCVLSVGCGSGLFEWLLKESLSKLVQTWHYSIYSYRIKNEIIFFKIYTFMAWKSIVSGGKVVTLLNHLFL